MTVQQLDDLKAYQNVVDVPRALAVEEVLHHNELKIYAAQGQKGGGILHLFLLSLRF